MSPAAAAVKLPHPYPVWKDEPKYTKLFINNEWRNSQSGKVFTVLNPATGEPIADVQEGDKADVNEAVAAARAAFQRGSPWRRMDAHKRGELLIRVAELIERDSVYIASLETLNGGQPYSFAYTVMLKTAARLFRYFAGWADKLHGKTIPVAGDFFCYTRREAVGVVGHIVPWNFPLVTASWKLAPTLATGNTLVLKPAEQTPLTALYLASLFKEAGFPAGVVNVVPGFGETAGSAIAHHPHVDKVGFTGSNEVGRLIMQAAAKTNLKRVTLELGGKCPLIIFADADLNQAVELASLGAFFNQGQCCFTFSRTFVEASIYDAFVARAKLRAEKMRVGLGDPFSAETESGPSIDAAQLAKTLRYIELGKREGAKLVCGGKRHGTKGFYVEPTVFSEVRDGMRIAQEEIFGPVMSVIKFDCLDDLVEKANNTIYGLYAGIVTHDLDKTLYVANNMRVGVVWVNCFSAVDPAAPFGGYKMSGFGREMGEDGLEQYTEVKTVVIKVTEKNS